MLNFIHVWLNPHCPECKEDMRERMICESCETLKTQLEAERYNNRQLLNAILPPKLVQSTEEVRVPINPKNIPWHVRQQMLENEDKKKFQLIREKELEKVESIKSTEELEFELLGEKNVPS